MKLLSFFRLPRKLKRRLRLLLSNLGSKMEPTTARNKRFHHPLQPHHLQQSRLPHQTGKTVRTRRIISTTKQEVEVEVEVA